MDLEGFHTLEIDSKQMKWSTAQGKIGYCVLGFNPDKEDEEPTKWCINGDLHYMIRAYYHHNNPVDDNLEIIGFEAYKKTGKREEDQALIEEWVENGGKYNAQLKAAPTKRKKSASKRKGAVRSQGAKSFNKKPRAKAAAPVDLSRSSSSDEVPLKKKLTIFGGKIDLSLQEEDDDDSDATSMG